MKNQEFLRAPFYVMFANGQYLLHEYNRNYEFRVTVRAFDYESIGNYQIFKVVGDAFYVYYYDRRKSMLVEVGAVSSYKVYGEYILYQRYLKSAGDSWILWGISGSQCIGLPFGDPQYHCYVDGDILSFVTQDGQAERHSCLEISLTEDVPSFSLLDNRQMKLEIVSGDEDWDQNIVKAVEI